jgi:hypothetical protein
MAPYSSSDTAPTVLIPTSMTTRPRMHSKPKDSERCLHRRMGYVISARSLPALMMEDRLHHFELNR